MIVITTIVITIATIVILLFCPAALRQAAGSVSQPACMQLRMARV